MAEEYYFFRRAFLNRIYFGFLQQRPYGEPKTSAKTMVFGKLGEVPRDQGRRSQGGPAAAGVIRLS